MFSPRSLPASRFARRRLSLERLEDRRVLSADALASVSPWTIDPEAYRDDRLLVRWEPDATPASPWVERWELLDEEANLFAAHTLPQQDPAAVAAALQEAPGVVYAQPDYALQLTAVPNDPLLDSLYAIASAGGGDIDLLDAWDVRHDAREIVVGVIDTGVDFRHEDLAANIWRNTDEIAGNGRDDDGNGYIDDVIGWDFVGDDNNPMDDNGHGTHVAGTIGAVGDNGRGVAGVAWNVRIMPLKFMNAHGSGYVSDAIAALDYARENGARIVNNSWSGVGYSRALEDAITRYEEDGGLFVAAAGNESSNNDLAPTYPANFGHGNVITVAASDAADRLASFSNYGVASVDVAAPGDRILSTLPGDRYGYMSGTSMAAPHVSGAAALIWAEHPGWTAAEVRNHLLQTADPVLTEAVAAGRLNLGAALQAESSPEIAASVRQQWIGADPATLTGARLTFADPADLDSFDPASYRIRGPQGGLDVLGVSRIGETQLFLRIAPQTAAGAYRLLFQHQPDRWTELTRANLEPPVSLAWSGGLRLRDAVGGTPGRTHIAFHADQAAVVGDLDFRLRLRHADAGQLRVSLVAPDGRQAVLWDRDASPGGIATTWNDEGELRLQTPRQALSRFDGASLQGKWRLVVEDFRAGSRGWLEAFEMTVRPPARVGGAAGTSAASTEATASAAPHRGGPALEGTGEFKRPGPHDPTRSAETATVASRDTASSDRSPAAPRAAGPLVERPAPSRSHETLDAWFTRLGEDDGADDGRF